MHSWKEDGLWGKWIEWRQNSKTSSEAVGLLPPWLDCPHCLSKSWEIFDDWGGWSSERMWCHFQVILWTFPLISMVKNIEAWGNPRVSLWRPFLGHFFSHISWRQRIGAKGRALPASGGSTATLSIVAERPELMQFLLSLSFSTYNSWWPRMSLNKCPSCPITSPVLYPFLNPPRQPCLYSSLSKRYLPIDLSVSVVFLFFFFLQRGLISFNW